MKRNRHMRRIGSGLWAKVQEICIMGYFVEVRSQLLEVDVNNSKLDMKIFKDEFDGNYLLILMEMAMCDRNTSVRRTSRTRLARYALDGCRAT